MTEDECLEYYNRHKNCFKKESEEDNLYHKFQLSIQLIGAKILIIDDEKAITNMLSTYLNNFKFITANYPEKAIKIFGTEKPNLIITDLNMLKMNGIKFTKLIRERNNYVPIILMSGIVN